MGMNGKNAYPLKWAIDYIEEHLNEPIQLEELAKTCYISLMQLYREFQRTSGHSIKDYIRKRRISNACIEIKYSPLPITGTLTAGSFCAVYCG
ncbi:AraC family transcriptional regulator [Paenibacillus donghaensis]|uniref:HTH araC/xylS-type domain-containing protein n=1 Tax=Paenibacillus donghaensis TaxID=414771 RepID=A0A2Z2KLI6_9BACL|nr:AraC family transcriptional regulator [Paenibacillus donghaensis]ASA25175.1 hypothetical protein B9T62_33240 [Paenibacillus donghaensis]